MIWWEIVICLNKKILPVTHIPPPKPPLTNTPLPLSGWPFHEPTCTVGWRLNTTQTLQSNRCLPRGCFPGATWQPVAGGEWISSCRSISFVFLIFPFFSPSSSPLAFPFRLYKMLLFLISINRFSLLVLWSLFLFFFSLAIRFIYYNYVFIVRLMMLLDDFLLMNSFLFIGALPSSE